MEYPEMLYVREQEVSYPYPSEIKHLVGSGYLESIVPANEREEPIAVYKLVRTEVWKKTLTTKVNLEKIK